MSDSNNSDVFFDDMPTFEARSKKRGGGGSGEKRPENIVCYLKTTNGPKEFYAFRLLAFRGKDGVERKNPYIERYVHTMWTTNSNGKRFPECTVVCPVTSHVSWARGKDRYEQCPICGHAQKAFAQFKQSGWKNREAAKINDEFGRKFEGLLPVYVVKDPNNPMNNGKFRVLLIGDKKKFDEIIETIEVLVKQGIHVYNGGEALDLYMQFGPVEHKSHEGQPNERVWTKNEITRFRFSNKAYEIPAITPDAIRAFPFDEQYYVESTPEELKEFYDRYCVPPAGNVEEDFDFDEPMDVPAKPAAKPIPKPATPPPPPPPTNSASSNDDFEFDDQPAEAVAPPPKVAPVVEKAEKPAESMDADLKKLDSELDEFLNYFFH